MKQLFVIVILLSAVFSAGAQTGTWSGPLEVQGTRISLVFHLDGENPTMDSPDQGTRDIDVVREDVIGVRDEEQDQERRKRDAKRGCEGAKHAAHAVSD